ncbi:MAG: hypothetical protein ACLFN2_07480 [Bacteroidales bacterium]
MRNGLLICMAFAGMLGLQACEDLLDVEETFTFEQEFTIVTDQTNFSEWELLDLESDVDIIEEYGDKIKDVHIEKAEFWLKELQGVEGQRFEGGSVSVADPDGSNITLITSIGQHNLADLLDEPHPLQTEQAGLNKLGGLAEEPPHSFRLYYDASVNEGPVAFTVVFSFTGKMVANPL